MFIKGAQIGPSLKNLAERRTDIFGSEETVIGRKVHIYIYVHIGMYARSIGICSELGCSSTMRHKPPCSYAYPYIFPMCLSKS